MIKKKKSEFIVLRQMGAQRKMNACGNFEIEHFSFFLAQLAYNSVCATSRMNILFIWYHYYPISMEIFREGHVPLVSFTWLPFDRSYFALQCICDYFTWKRRSGAPVLVIQLKFSVIIFSGTKKYQLMWSAPKQWLLTWS